MEERGSGFFATTFCFQQKKNADVHRIICKIYKNVIAIRTCAN